MTIQGSGPNGGRTGFNFSAMLQGLLAGLCAWWGVTAGNAGACPFCAAPATTYSEQLETAEAVVFVEWQACSSPDPATFAAGQTIYRIKSVYRPGASTVRPGDLVTLDYYQSGQAGETFWMLGTTVEGKCQWALPVLMSQACWDYAIQAPLRSVKTSERLRYYLKSLEHPDVEIAIDAYGEFAGAPYSQLVEISSAFNRADLLKWLSDPITPPTRRGLYGLMLGLCGSQEDAAYLEAIVLEQPEETRFGIDGMLAGYVLLTGEQGLQRIAEKKLSDRQTPTSEAYAVMQMLRFLWEYAPERVPRAQLIQAMRVLVDRPELASLAILDLARWKDWELTAMLTQRYGTESFSERDVKQAVIRFVMLAAEEQASPEGIVPTGGQISIARECLQTLRAKDPATVKYVERHTFD